MLSPITLRKVICHNFPIHYISALDLEPRHQCLTCPSPSREEINVYDSLDERSACRNFLGKTLDQAEALFRESSLYYQEGLMWMGPVAFRYYIQAAINYPKRIGRW
jgi:hypothetical protein